MATETTDVDRMPLSASGNVSRAAFSSYDALAILIISVLLWAATFWVQGWYFRYATDPSGANATEERFWAESASNLRSEYWVMPYLLIAALLYWQVVVAGGFLLARSGRHFLIQSLLAGLIAAGAALGYYYQASFDVGIPSRASLCAWLRNGDTLELTDWLFLLGDRVIWLAGLLVAAWWLARRTRAWAQSGLFWGLLTGFLVGGGMYVLESLQPAYERVSGGMIELYERGWPIPFFMRHELPSEEGTIVTEDVWSLLSLAVDFISLVLLSAALIAPVLWLLSRRPRVMGLAEEIK